MTMPTAPWSQPTGSPDPLIVPGPLPRRTRWRWVLAGVLGVIGLGVVGTVVLVGLDDTALRHDLVTADFEQGADPFETGTIAQYRASVEDGEYVLTANTDATGQAVSFAAFTRTAYSVTVEATVTGGTDAYGDNWFGVACLDRSSDEALGYLFVVSSVEAALTSTSPSGGRTLVSDESFGRLPSDGARLKIACTPSPTGGPVTITGYLDGEQVLTATDADGVGKFRSAALVFRAYDVGDDIHIDDVIARVPGQ